MSLKDVDNFFGEIGKVIKVLFLACAIALPCIGIYMGLTGQVKKGSGYNRHQWQQKYQAEENKRRLQEQHKFTQEDLERLQQQQQQQQQQRSGSPRPHYQELWNDAEYYAYLLDENDIEHESLDYPIDYHDLEDLKDNFENLLIENEIDY